MLHELLFIEWELFMAKKVFKKSSLPWICHKTAIFDFLCHFWGTIQGGIGGGGGGQN